MKFLLTLLCSLLLLAGKAQDINRMIREGNDYYSRQQFEQAAAAYQAAVKADPSNAIATFNLAAALHRTGNAAEAARLFEAAAGLSNDNGFKARAWFNKGAVLSSQQQTEESITAYKQSLRLDPHHVQARENLQKALLELKKKNPPKQNQDNKKKQKKEQDKKKQQQPKMSQQEAEQRLKLLEQKERELQERLQKEKAKGGGQQAKDW